MSAEDGSESTPTTAETRRTRGRIALRLFVAVGLPASLVVVVLGVLAWSTTRNAVEASLQRELQASVAVAASTVSATAARVALPGEEASSRMYRRSVARLSGIQQSTGSVRAMIVDGDEKVRADGTGAIPIGTPAPRIALDRVEFQRALAGSASVSVPFTGDDGNRYMAAYARIPEAREETEGEPGAPLVLALEAPAAALDATEAVAKQIALLVLSSALVVVALALVVARTITTPLTRLAAEAERLGRGELKQALELPRPLFGDDEVTRLGATIEAMRRALVDRDAERQMMLAGIAHEVRNPLGGMELFSGLLEEGVADLDETAVGAPVKAELGSQAARVRKELGYLTEVVNSFLAFARDIPLQTEPVDIRALCEDVVSLCARDGAAPITIDADERLTVSLDRGRIKQALLNLVENSLAATPPGGRVTVRAHARDDRLVFDVEDTGKGMDAATLDKVFTPFFTTKEKGSGLGLALVRKLARDHGGEATITSTVGVGTRVRLDLPLPA